MQVKISAALLPIWMWCVGDGQLFPTSKCSDSMVEGRIKADCRLRGLVNIFDVRLDPSTKVLDLTENEFKRLSPNQFLNEGLDYLEEIILRSNEIEKIDSQAFNGLALLRLLDLSKNRITSFSLAYMPPLRTLNMSHNPLYMEFTIYSTTLEVLDLYDCSLPVIPIKLYSDLPSLQHLNLSNNRIENIFLPGLQHMRLRTIQLSRNPIRCTEDTEKVINWFERQRIQYTAICLHYPTARSNPTTRKDSVLVAPQSLPSEQSQQPTPSYDQCLVQLKSMRNEQRLFAVMSLAVHVSVLIIVVVFFGLFLSYRFNDVKEVTRHVTGVEEEADSEVAPPPYRSRSYAAGFRV